MLEQLGKWLQGKKSYLVVAAAILTAIAGYAQEQITLVQMIQAIFIALGFGAGRSAIGKISK